MTEIGKGYASSRSTFSTAWRQCNESDFLLTSMPMKTYERSLCVYLTEVPNVRHISEFVRRRVKVEFDPDFGDLRGESRKAKDNESGKRNGIYAADSERKRAPLKCYVCGEEHRVVECPSMLKATIPERLELVKRAGLCFSCLNRGHSKKDCRGKRKCDKNESCPNFHHPLLHSDPPPTASVSNVTEPTTSSTVGSILDKSSPST